MFHDIIMQQDSQTDKYYLNCIFEQRHTSPDAQIYPYNRTNTVGIGKDENNGAIITSNYTTFKFDNP